MATVLIPPAFSPREPLPKRWTRDEYRKLIDDGYLTDGKCELIEGEIIEKMSHARRHIIALTRLTKILGAIFGPDLFKRRQLCLSAPPAIRSRMSPY